MNPIKPEEERFADTAAQLSKAIHYNITNLYNLGYKTIDPNVILLISNAILFYDKHQLIQGFITNSHIQCWDKIRDRDQQFFVDNAADIFKYLPSGEVNLFKDLFTTKDQNGNEIVDNDIKIQIWRLFDAMVKISIKYIHKNRAPFSQKENDVTINYYDRIFFDDVDIKKHSDLWKVTLEFHPKISS